MRRASRLLKQVLAEPVGRPATRWVPVQVARPRMLSTKFVAEEDGAQLVQLEHGPNGVSTLKLCRPKKLNSLSHCMIKDLRQRYDELAPSGVRCVLLRGEGRALCAGGDVAGLRDGVLSGTRLPNDFFAGEYELDYHIATLHEREGVLQVALWDGIVMGGGVGLSVHCPIRIATEKTLFAMPETGIGLFPDVGGTWALSRLSAGSHVGLMLGLTGERLGAADCLYAGLATHYCPSDLLPQVEARVRELGDRAGDVAAVSAVISEVSHGVSPDTSKAFLEANSAALERCFGGSVSSAEEVAQRLEAEGGDWAAKTLATLRKKSPTSVKVTFEAIRRHQSVNLQEAFMMEYRLSQWFMRPPPHSDFCEGIRAVLVDKDNAPKWDPPTLEEVTQDRVESFFAPLGPDHPVGELQL